MLAAVGLQTIAVMIGVLIAALVGGLSSAWSLFLGGAAAVVPNALFALRLSRHQNKPAESYPVVFFLGEMTKIGLTIGAVGLILKFHPGASWLEVMIGLIVGLKAVLFALWFTGDRTDKVIVEAQAAKEIAAKELAAQEAASQIKANELAQPSSNDTK